MKGDLELLERWHRGDAVAANELIRRHHASVMRVASRVLGRDADGAAEVTQRVLEMLLHLQGEGIRNLGAYVRGMARFAAIEYLRERGRCPKPPVEQPRGLLSALVHRHRHRTMLAALRLLAWKDQQLLARAYGSQKRRKQLAAELGLGTNQMNCRLHRVRRHLKERVEELEAVAGTLESRGGWDTWLASVERKAAEAAARQAASG